MSSDAQCRAPSRFPNVYLPTVPLHPPEALKEAEDNSCSQVSGPNDTGLTAHRGLPSGPDTLPSPPPAPAERQRQRSAGDFFRDPVLGVAVDWNCQSGIVEGKASKKKKQAQSNAGKPPDDGSNEKKGGDDGDGDGRGADGNGDDVGGGDTSGGAGGGDDGGKDEDTNNDGNVDPDSDWAMASTKKKKGKKEHTDADTSQTSNNANNDFDSNTFQEIKLGDDSGESSAPDQTPAVATEPEPEDIWGTVTTKKGKENKSKAADPLLEPVLRKESVLDPDVKNENIWSFDAKASKKDKKKKASAWEDWGSADESKTAAPAPTLDEPKDTADAGEDFWNTFSTGKKKKGKHRTDVPATARTRAG